MARPLRPQFPGAVYHINARGNDKQDIYCTDLTGPEQEGSDLYSKAAWREVPANAL